MARSNVLIWLYKHSPVNFYSLSENGETIIKSINNTGTGYKFDFVFEQKSIERLRRVTKNFKRGWTMTLLLMYALCVYGVIFPYYQFWAGNLLNSSLIIVALLLLTVLMAFVNSKLFEKYLKINFGEFTKVHFPSSNSIENQSYRDFKTELFKISALILFLFGVYLCIGSPYATSIDLIKKEKYDDVIKITSLWAKILPIEPSWYSLRAYAKFKKQDYDGAISDYDTAYRLENDEFKNMNFDNKIYVKYYTKDYRGALDDFDSSIAKVSEESDKNSFMWDKAQFLYTIGQYKNALSIYNLLIANSDSDVVFLLQNRLYYERGLVYQKLGDEKNAQKDFDKARELNLEQEFETDIPLRPFY